MLKILSFGQKVNGLEQALPEARSAFQVIRENAQKQDSRPVPMSALLRRMEPTKKPKEQIEKAIRYYADLQGIEVK